MTIIFTSGTWWIEYHVHPRESVLTTALMDVTIALDRPGTYLGGQVTGSSGLTDTSAFELYNTTGATQLTVGLNIADVRIIAKNNELSTNTMGFGLLIFMRKST